MAQCAALLRLAGPGCARALVHARRARAARRAFPQVKGSRIEHDKLLAFIGRNYLCDDEGCWFFQNGPQRVYVELETTPWIWRLQPDGNVLSHTGQLATVEDSRIDETGRLYLVTDLGFGLVHSLDVQQAAEFVERGIWRQSLAWPNGPNAMASSAARSRPSNAHSQKAKGRLRRPFQHGSSGFQGPRQRQPEPWARRTWRRPGWPCRPRRGRSRNR